MSLRQMLSPIRRWFRPSSPPDANALRQAEATAAHQRWTELAARCAGNPTAPDSHLRLAEHFLALDKPMPAHACYRTALALGAERVAAIDRGLESHGIRVGVSVNHAAPASAAATPVAQTLEFQRLARIADRVRALLGGQRGTILDVGGGTGALAVLLPECDYFLAEPGVNGVGSAEARLFGRRFTIVTCCHVLEHIPAGQKTAFLADLASLAERHVLLLGPSIDTPVPAIDAVYLKITNSIWAAEHIACGWPKIADMRAFAASQGLACQATPNGDMAATYWMVFASHYAAAAGREHEMGELLAFYNREICPDPKAPSPPNDYLVELSHPAPSSP